MDTVGNDVSVMLQILLGQRMKTDLLPGCESNPLVPRGQSRAPPITGEDAARKVQSRSDQARAHTSGDVTPRIYGAVLRIHGVLHGRTEMSRRKQEKPQPRKQLLEVEENGLQDILTCGGCQRDFTLSDIVKFIHHKVHSCNKENFEKLANNHNSHDDGDSPFLSKRPGISAPLTNKLTSKVRVEDHQNKNGLDLSSLSDNSHEESEKKLKVDADTNTTETEPNNYVCSTCKQTVSSAWSLVQHVQNLHGIKIYVDSGSVSTRSTPSSLPPPPIVNGNDHHPIQPPLNLDTSSQAQFPIIRMPLGERQFGATINSHNFFPRPPTHEFRMDLISDQLHRINHHTPLTLPSPFESHFDRNNFERPRSSQLSMGFEPQLDFYSQRLRQLAGATSPNPTPSPRKLTPPFSQASTTLCSRPSSNPSTPTPQNAQPPKTQQSSCSSTSSKLSEQPGSPKLKSCEFCGKSFRFQSNLVVHRRSHTGEKPYKCHICNHACTQSSKLKRHMKTHKLNNSGNGSENNSLLSARSTPDSDPAKDNELDNDIDDDGSDGQTADNEEDEEEEFDDEDDEEEEEEEDEDGLDDDDINSNMIAEDLSTRSIVTSTPKSCNNGEINSKDKNETKHSILGEVMENIGLNNIKHYTEAYHQALEESSQPKPSVKLEKALAETESNNNGLSKRMLENGPSKEENKILALTSLEFGHGILGAFDNPFDATKRLKLDLGGDSLYAGIWRPTSSNSHRDLLLGTNDRHKSDSAFKSALSLVNSRPGTSASLLNSPGSNKLKNDRRNDTCEYCGKIFKNCSNLTVHRRSHTGEKPYKCGLCSYACAQSSKLTRHMKTHGRMGKDVYRCRFCDMPFSVPSTLEKHMRKCVVHQNVVGMLADKDSDSKETP